MNSKTAGTFCVIRNKLILLKVYETLKRKILSTMSRIRGLELQFTLLRDKLQSKQDCVVAALHCLLINEQLQCVGTGEHFADTDPATELLPDAWNRDQTLYTLRYSSRDRKNKFLVKVVRAGNILHVNIVLNEDNVAAMSVNVNSQVADDFSSGGGFESVYLDLESLSSTFRRDIIEKLVDPPPDKASEKKSEEVEDRPRSPPAANPLLVNRPPPQYQGPDLDFDDDRFGGRHPCFPQIGGQDLDPLGRAPGGMLLDPFHGREPRVPHIPGLPRGAVPPGARFDPFGPNIPGPNRGRPNPDHFRRPGGFDDDFM